MTISPLSILPIDVKQILPTEANELPRGSAILVRSDYKYEIYGDHPALILGGSIKKDRGFRPNILTFPGRIVENITDLLNQFDPIDGKVILLLNQKATNEFMTVQKIHLSEGELYEVEALNILSTLLK